MPSDDYREGCDDETLLTERLAFLRSAKDHQYEILKWLFAADTETLYHADFVAFGVMQRSTALIDGFALLVEHKNALAAAPLLRLQIDSVIRFNACWLVDDSTKITNALWDDRPLNKVKDRTGQRMTDSYLARAISDRYPWLPDAYKQASSFIHLSVRQLTAPIVSTDSQSRQIRMALGPGREWTVAERLEAVDIFIRTTDALFRLILEWTENRRMLRDSRTGS